MMELLPAAGTTAAAAATAIADAGQSAAGGGLDAPKIRISKIGGRYLVFDVADVACLRRQHNMCSVLVGITPQAPNQGVFSGLPLELAPDEVQWLVQDRQAAYVADDWADHLAGLTNPARRRSYMESVARQRQAAQASADEDAAERRKRSVEARARMAASSKKGGRQGKTGKAGKAGNASKASSIEEEKEEGEGEQAPVEKEDARIETAAATIPPPAREEVLLSEKSGKAEKTDEAAAVVRPNHRVRITPTTSAGLVPSSCEALGEGRKLTLSRLPPVAASSQAAAWSSYALRAHLAERGYFATPGLRFGGDLSIYPGDPFRYHAHFVAKTYGWNEPIPLLDLVGTGRLATGVKKGLLIGGGKPPGSSKDDDAHEVDEVDKTARSGIRAFTLEWAAI